LLHCLQDQSVERLFLPFVALHQLAEVADQERAAPKSLREIITAGEQLHITPPISALFSRLSDCKLRNQYGPSETHVVSAFTPAGSPSDWSPLPSIGQPIANCKIYILDRYQKSVPIGVAGELWIGGAGLARGYLNRAELTAEKFIPDPFSDECGARLYKTGDLARYLPDGNIEFLGRIDHQVKIRGFRIELGEIESALGLHPAVGEAVVLAREDDENPKSGIENLKSDKRLVAYVVPSHGPAPTTNELQAFLKEKLPEYMIPLAFVLLDALPLTPNGKVDRKVLPPPDQNRAGPEESYVAPRTPVEELLAEIWAEVLKLDKVGAHDNFFELGGHSLLATQVMSRLHDTFHLNLPLQSLFENPTIDGLARMIQTTKVGSSISPAAPITPVSRQLYSTKMSL
jgi:acyl-coenzyme A synthetase/AMP-(fatty) acid ligase/acyl carrier protein